MQGGKHSGFFGHIVNNIENYSKNTLNKIKSAAMKKRNERDQNKINKLKKESLANGGSGSNLAGLSGNNVSLSSSNNNKWVRNLSVAVIVAIAIGAGGVFKYEQNVHNASQAHENNVAKRLRDSHVSFIVQTLPRAVIFSNDARAGQANKQGLYRFTSVPVGTKLYAQYGKNKTSKLTVLRSDKESKVHLNFAFLNKTGAQHQLNILYRCISNLVNHNDQDSGNHSLDDFYVNGNKNRAYQAMYRWAKFQNRSIDVKPNPKNKKAVAAGALQDIHFVNSIQGVQLGADGVVTIRYQIKNDFARSKQDHVDVFNWVAKYKKLDGHWLILDAKSAAKPVKSYNP